MPDFSERLQYLRKKRKMTQQQVADMLGITRQAYGNYEKGRGPDLNTLETLASFFNVNTDYLLGRTDNPSPIEDIAAHRSDDPMDDLPADARRSLEEFREHILRKYGKFKE